MSIQIKKYCFSGTHIKKYLLLVFLITCTSLQPEKQVKKPGFVISKKTHKYKGLDFRLIKGPVYWLYFRGKTAQAQKNIAVLEQFYNREYHKFFDKKPKRKIRVVLFKNEQEYLKKTRSPDGQYAHYDPRTGLLLSWDQKNPGNLFHESIHKWLHANNHLDVSMWFNEGFASYFESPKFRPDGSWIYDRNNFRMTEIQNQWTPLHIFLKRIDLPHSHSKAQARLIFLYLADKGKLTTFVKAYLENAFVQKDGILALENTINLKLSQINTDLKVWRQKNLETQNSRLTN